jgi:hypothetical protein
VDLTIISGGQTGADRAALDFAIHYGLPHAGWCPRGRLAEDGRLDAIYCLEETPSPRYDERTRWNVRDSDATLVVTMKRKVTGGTSLTLGACRQLSKPCLHLDAETTPDIDTAAAQLVQFLQQHEVQRLNVAGPRASQEPEIGALVRALLAAAMGLAAANEHPPGNRVPL